MTEAKSTRRSSAASAVEPEPTTRKSSAGDVAPLPVVPRDPHAVAEPDAVAEDMAHGEPLPSPLDLEVEPLIPSAADLEWAGLLAERDATIVALRQQVAGLENLARQLGRERDDAMAGRLQVRVGLTEAQRAKNEQRRRREMATQPIPRLVEVLMRTDGRTKTELLKLGRSTLVSLIIEAERKQLDATIPSR